MRRRRRRRQLKEREARGTKPVMSRCIGIHAINYRPIVSKRTPLNVNRLDQGDAPHGTSATTSWQMMRARENHRFSWVVTLSPDCCGFHGSTLPEHGLCVCYVIFLPCLPLCSVHAKSQIKESICDYSYKTKRKILDENITFWGF